MSGVTLRDFEPRDLDALLALWLEAFGALKPEDEAARLLETARANAGLFVVAELDRRIVGTALGTTDTRRGFLYHVAVAREHRRRGIASALVARRASGCSRAASAWSTCGSKGATTPRGGCTARWASARIRP